VSYGIRIHQFGGPEVLKWEEFEVGDPGPGQVKVKHSAAGVNFVDTMQRRGLVHPLAFPLVLGRGGAGVVVAIGAGVRDIKIGDRVAYAPYTGSYCEERLIEAAKLVPVPEGLDDQIVGATILQGLTVQFLVRQVHRVASGDTIFVHAAAGGVGLILCQWAAHLGARVVGAVSSREKAELARQHGCEDVVVYSDTDFVSQGVAFNGGNRFDVVYDSVGQDTFLRSLDLLRPAGLIVSFGLASGEVPSVDLGVLRAKGGLAVSTGGLLGFTEGRGRLREMAAEWFGVLGSGTLKIEVNQRYPLREAARAHRDLESRRTTGSTVLVV